ncbi:hypothetical protein ACFX2K_028615 [Malus domestica]
MCRAVIGLLVGGKLFWVLDDVTSSLEVFFLHPGVVSLTDEDAQGVIQVAELGDFPKEVTDKVSNQTSKQATWIRGSISASG